MLQPLNLDEIDSMNRNDVDQYSLWDLPVMLNVLAFLTTICFVLRPPWLQLTNQFFESLGHRLEVPKLHGYGSK